MADIPPPEWTRSDIFSAIGAAGTCLVGVTSTVLLKMFSSAKNATIETLKEEVKRLEKRLEEETPAQTKKNADAAIEYAEKARECLEKQVGKERREKEHLLKQMKDLEERLGEGKRKASGLEAKFEAIESAVKDFDAVEEGIRNMSTQTETALRELKPISTDELFKMIEREFDDPAEK